MDLNSLAQRARLADIADFLCRSEREVSEKIGG
jgi:hypothetical protein